MSMSFSRSIRLMQQDSFRGGLVALALLLVFLLGWAGWFFLASIPLYVTSRQYQVTRTGTLQVTFAAQERANILPGQSAVVFIPESAGQPAQTLTAEVLSVPDPKGTVALYLFSPEKLSAAQGEIKIEVGALSPAEMVMQAAGQWVGKP